MCLHIDVLRMSPVVWIKHESFDQRVRKIRWVYGNHERIGSFASPSPDSYQVDTVYLLLFLSYLAGSETFLPANSTVICDNYCSRNDQFVGRQNVLIHVPFNNSAFDRKCGSDMNLRTCWDYFYQRNHQKKEGLFIFFYCFFSDVQNIYQNYI